MKSNSIIYKGIRFNGLWWVADFEIGSHEFCLDAENLQTRINTLVKNNKDCSVESAALAELKTKKSEGICQ